MVRPGAWLKWLGLCAAWIIFILLFLSLGEKRAFETLRRDGYGPAIRLQPPDNQTGPVSYSSWEPKKNHRPIRSISFSNLISENGRLGIFKTALQKVVKLQDLKLSFYRYGRPKTPATGTARSAKAATNAVSDIHTLISIVSRKLTGGDDGLRIENLDLSNVSEVRVNNISYRIFQNGNLFLHVQSKRAEASVERADVILRGHVIIVAENGRRLECNHATWYTAEDMFHIEGVYVLNRNGAVTSGRNICVDSRLDPVEIRTAKSL